MNSIDSYQSKATINAQSIISKIATRNGQANNSSLITALDEETVSAAWNAFGLHISRQLRMGRGVAVNKFGTFSFSAPDVVLDGVTNPVDRDKQPRQPVFLVAKVLFNLNLKLKDKIIYIQKKLLSLHFRSFNTLPIQANIIHINLYRQFLFMIMFIILTLAFIQKLIVRFANLQIYIQYHQN